MQIDWVTVIAQIINFLILVGLLKLLLYRPITRAMENRRQAIKSQIEEAEQREQEAEDRGREYEEKRRSLEQQRDDVLEGAQTDAEQRRQEMIEEARREVEGLERRWRENLREEREAFLRELRRRMGSRLCAVARDALQDLANAELQSQVVSVFLDRIDDLDEERRRELGAAVEEAQHPPEVISAFDLSEDERERLEGAVRDVLDTDRGIEFQLSQDLVCGVELNLGGRKLAWSLDSYLDRLEESIAEVLASEAEEEEENERVEAD